MDNPYDYTDVPNVAQQIPTPHISALYGDYAKTVLMPGDPLRAKFIAEKYLIGAKLVNEVRGMLGFTGTYKGKPVSVQGSGMGMPSMGIYSYELFNFYGVESIIRIGSTGSLADDLNIGDIVISVGACTDSNYALSFGLPGVFAPTADYSLLERAVRAASAKGARFKTGNILSTDVFYGETPDAMEKWRDMGVLAVEMETAALYMNAARAGKKALGLLTVADEIYTGKSTTSEQRQNSFTEMMEIALELI